MALCNDKEQCAGMKKALKANKGIVATSYINIKTGDEVGDLIGFRKNKSERLIGFRVCPFCTQPINTWLLKLEETK